ncbi:MAG: class I poly(R)-hydroxyalkanoic acid synthase [Alphaproteobacteria bacterium]|nr:class I poly(R)-hydroxyalkanoic acid synthase [Alphaproteobacteria bacterium]
MAEQPEYLRNPAGYALEVSRTLGAAALKGQKAWTSAMQAMWRGPMEMPVDPRDFGKAFLEFTQAWATSPQKLLELNARWAQDYFGLWTMFFRRVAGEEVEPVATPAAGDRRFRSDSWNDRLAFDFLKQAYLVVGRQLQDLVAATPEMNPESRAKVDFFVRQYVNAVSPSNFASTNPDVIAKTLATGGLNLLTGFSNLLDDLARGDGLVKHRSPADFELGRNIAATPGAVVFQNELMQLIQYDPSTDKVAKRPILFIPPVVNKFYHFDLSPRTSFLKWLVDQGYTVFVISWVNPDARLASMGIDDYVGLGPLAAIDAIRDATGEESVNVASFCMGGTLTAATLAWLAAKGHGDRVASATMIATLLDFTAMGDFSVFVSDAHIQAMRKYLEKRGFVDANDLTRLFSVVRANDQIWSPAVSHYLMGQESAPSDLLYWFADGARIPERMLNDVNANFVHGNKLREPGAVTVGGVALDLTKVTTPVYLVSLKDDHVAEWRGTYLGTQLFGGETHFLLGGSGHNAGTLSAPSANKHGYWFNEAPTPADADAWLAGAKKYEGSWWPRWEQWLKTLSGGEVAARKVGSGKLKPIEPAPGSYVRMRS